MLQIIANHPFQTLVVGMILGSILSIVITYIREGKVTLHDLIVCLLIGIVGSYFIVIFGTIVLCEEGMRYLKKHDKVLVERHPVSVGRGTHEKYDHVQIRIR